MRLASVNMHKTSHGKELARWLAVFMYTNGVQGLLMQELTGDDGRHLRHQFGPKHTVVQLRHGEGALDNGILFRGKFAKVACVRMGNKRWWGWRTRRPHAPRWLTEGLTEGGVTIGSTHAPPGVDAAPTGLRGKADRVAAWVAFVRAFRRWAKRHDRFVVAADWNDPARNRGKFSIRWLARLSGCKIHTLGGIDYVLAKGVKVKPVGKFDGGPGMDHDIFLFEVMV